MTTYRLCEFELDVLKMLAGAGPDIPWGAAVGAALGFLKGSGHVTIIEGTYTISDKGRAVLGEVAK